MASSSDSSAHSQNGQHHGLARYLIESVYAIILGMTVGGWTVIGFVVWVPLLIRTTTVLAGAVLYATLFHDQGRIANSQQAVHFAVGFYVLGFQHFVLFYRQRHDPQPQMGLFEPLAAMRWKELAVECAWVLGVWVVLYWLFHAAFSFIFG